MSQNNNQKIFAQLAQELQVRLAQITATVRLLDEGATVPFIARYRKEVTEGLDDAQLRDLETRLVYLRELEERRDTILKSIAEQEKLTPELQAAILAATTKQELEDLYLPYRPKRRTKAMIAREAGIEPLADLLWEEPTRNPEDEAQAFINVDAGFADAATVLEGVRDILSERWAEDASLVGKLREWLWENGLFSSKLLSGKDETHADVARYRDYFDYSEPIHKVPSHRALAVFRGRVQDVLDAKLIIDETLQAGESSIAEGHIANALGWSHQNRAADNLLRKTITWAWRVKLSLSLERDLFSRLRESAEEVAIKIFANNLRDLLLAAPAGRRVVLGLDPGIRTGVKVAVVDDTGKVLDTSVIYPHEPRKDWEGSLQTLLRLCAAHRVSLIAIGNGTASRETDQLAGDLIEQLKSIAPDLKVDKVIVNEAGASIYSASEYASKELPELDVSLRGAVSIARRLQDPLAELVKIEPKSIGVGQYQHDVNQTQMASSLDTVIEDCVNKVGVDLNTASAPLLSRVSGLSNTVANNIVSWRNAHGEFRTRKQLLDVSGLGAKTFELSAGFLRIRDGDNPLDSSGVHPETYPVVEKILKELNEPIKNVMGSTDVLEKLRPELYADDKFGVITVKDILSELEKPGRDPRPDFKVARLDDTVKKMTDLKEGMVLEGTVTNVAAFGAFVDLGVHQDGLVHVSQLANRFVKDPQEVVKTGDVVKVKVLEVDLPRKRISLTMRLEEAAQPARQATGKRDEQNAPQRGSKGEQRGEQRSNGGKPQGHQTSHASNKQNRQPSAQPESAMAAAFAKLQTTKK